MTTILSLATVPVLALALSAGNAVPAGSVEVRHAAIAADATARCTPETLDLGELTAGTPKTVKLTVTNNTGSPLTVETMKAGCGCTKISDAPKTAIAAGESFTVDVTVDPGSKTGVDLSKTMTVAFVGGHTETITIKGKVKVEVEVKAEAAAN